MKALKSRDFHPPGSSENNVACSLEAIAAEIRMQSFEKLLKAVPGTQPRYHRMCNEYPRLVRLVALVLGRHLIRNVIGRRRIMLPEQTTIFAIDEVCVGLVVVDRLSLQSLDRHIGTRIGILPSQVGKLIGKGLLAVVHDADVLNAIPLQA